MRSRKTFISELIQRNEDRPEYWALETSFDPDKNQEIQTIRSQSLSGNQQPQSVKKDNNHGLAMQDLANALHQDIADSIKNCHLDKLKNTSLIVMPLGKVDAFCTKVDLNRQPLDGSVIIINEGMFYGLHLLFKGLVLESLDNDLLQYRRSGKSDFQHSLDFFLYRNSELLQNMHIKIGDAAIETEINRYQSAAATLILQFVALHEFGHIALEHFQQLDKNTEFINIFSSSSHNITQTHIALEYQADAFALQGLMQKSHSEQSMWANFYSIYLFFIWLETIQQKQQMPLSQLHPAPGKRARALRKIMESQIGNAELYQPMFENLDIMVANWKSH